LDPGRRRSERRLAIPRGHGARTIRDDAFARLEQSESGSNAIEDIILSAAQPFRDFNLREAYLGKELTLVLRYVRVILHLNQPLGQFGDADLPPSVLPKHCQSVRT
jgi:hypothetical protein